MKPRNQTNRSFATRTARKKFPFYLMKYCRLNEPNSISGVAITIPGLATTRLNSIRVFLLVSIVPIAILLQGCGNDPDLEIWHTEKLTGEFAESMLDDSVQSFAQYLELEQRLFNQLEEKIYTQTPTGPAYSLARYSHDSLSDPSRQQPNWNRTYELSVKQPQGGVLLLHGMSDAPYSLRALGESLQKNGYHVIGLRLPGHGTIPSGLRFVSWRDMSAAVSLAMNHLNSILGSKPIHIVGYSTGAPLAINFSLDNIENDRKKIPASLVLISPAIRVHPTGALAQFKNALSEIPGMAKLAFLSTMDEFDPYKYNSFATNAGAQVHHITRSVDQRIQALATDPEMAGLLPPILVLKSTVDSTVTTAAVVDNLLSRLEPDKNEIVLFDVNRNAAIKTTLMVANPGPLTSRLMADQELPFAVTLVSNLDPETNQVVARRKGPYSLHKKETEPLNAAWPRGVISLSHIALPFPPDDPLYGETPPENDDFIFLGNLAFRGERGLLRLPEDWLLRMRFNPFYEYLEQRTLQWIETSG